MIGNDKEFHWSRILPILQRQKFLFEPHVGQTKVSMHDHAFLELTYIQNGTVEHTLDGQTTVLFRSFWASAIAFHPSAVLMSSFPGAGGANS